MTFYFSPFKLSKGVTKGLLPTLSSASFQHKIHAKPTKSLLQKKTTPKKHQRGRTKAATKPLLHYSEAKCGQWASLEKGKGNICLLGTILFSRGDLESKLYPMKPPKQRNTP